MDFDTKWDIKGTIKYILKSKSTIIALQFPEEYFGECVLISRRLKQILYQEEKRNEIEIYILADSLYHDLSTDEIAADHINATSIIHYGRASLNAVKRIPSYFVFPADETFNVNELNRVLESSEFKERIKNENPKAIIIAVDQNIEYYYEAIKSKIININWPVNITFANYKSKEIYPIIEEVNDNDNVGCQQKLSSKNDIECNGLIFDINKDIEINECLFIWIGSRESYVLFQLNMKFPESSWITINNKDWNIETGLLPSVSHLLKKRAYLVEKTKNAKIIGILVTTLSIPGIVDLAERLKHMAEANGKKIYEIAMGKPSPQKLGNFPEIEVFIMVCDPSSMILDSKDYYAPLITPYEAQLAFMNKLLPFRTYRYNIDENLILNNDDVENEPRFSLIDGKLYEKKDSQKMSIEQKIAKRREMELNGTVPVADIETAADFFLMREFKGMDFEPPPPPNDDDGYRKIYEGKKGIASYYEHESKNFKK